MKKCSNTTIAITIIDENDNAPDLSQVPETFEFDEENPLVATIDGMDADKGDNKKLDYTVVSASSYVDRFSFQTNRIVANPPLNFETDTKSITISIMATDRGSPSRSTKKSITVSLV